MKKILPGKSVLAYALIFLMIAVSIVLKNREIILPEISALAIGCFIHEHPEWLAKPLYIFLLPSITAIGGFLINQLDIHIAYKLMLTVLVVLLTLLIFKSSLAPAMATGLLPVITNATSLYFIYAILTFTLLLFVFIFWSEGNPDKSKVLKRRRPMDSLLFATFVIAWILACYLSGWMILAAIPPVWVVAYESIHKETYTFKMYYKQVLCLTLSALTGILGLYILPNLLLATIFDIAMITLLLRLMKFNLTPAYPMALLPMVLHPAIYRYFSLAVLIMAIGVFGAIYSYKNIRATTLYRKANAAE